MRKIFTRRLVLLTIGFVLGANLAVSAKIFMVTAKNDSIGIDSLRGAIIAANRYGGENTIVLDGSPWRWPARPNSERVFYLTIAGVDETNSRTGDLDITRGKLTIIGTVPNIIIDATGLGDRVFQVFPNAQLTLKNLAIRGGTAPVVYGNFANGESGGAIYNAGSLILEKCIITNNASGGGSYVMGNGGGTGGGDGGGIYSKGNLTAFDCVIAQNLSGDGFDGADGGTGGGIRNDGICFLTRCIISGNRSGAGGGPGGNAIGWGGSGGNGGGIFNSGKLVLNDCNIGENHGGQGASGGQPGIADIEAPGGPGGNGGSGAAIYNVGNIQVFFSTIYGNTTGNGGNGGGFGSGGNAGTGGSGAGVYNASELSLNSTTVSGNTCGNGGAGGSAFFFNCNAADGGIGGSGGGIWNSGILDLTSCTIALNQTGAGGNGGDSHGGNLDANGGQGGDGGGIINTANATNALIRNTLIALNSVNLGGAGGTDYGWDFFWGNQPTPTVGSAGAIGFGFDVAGDFTSQRFYLIGMADGGTGFTNGINADQIGSNANPIDPLIGPLQMNDGLTPTHALLWGSPAIDQGKTFGIRFDQRTYYRPHTFTSISKPQGGDGGDIGAFELELKPAP